PLQATATETTTTIHPPPSQPQQRTTNSMLMKRIGELEHIMANLIQENKHLEERLDSHGARLYTLENLDIPHQYMNRDHSEELIKDLAKARKKKKKRRDSLKTPPGSPPYQPHPPPPPAGPSGASGSPGASGSSQVSPPPPPPPSTNQEDWWKPLEEEIPATQEPAWSIPSSDVPILKNNWASTLASNYSPPPEDSLLVQTGPAFELVKVFHPNVIHLQYQIEECHKLLTDSMDDTILRHNVSKPLPLGGPPGQVTIQSDCFFNKDLEYLRYGSKGSRPALSISKMNAAYYPDVGLEQMVPDQMWIEEEHTSEGDHKAIWTHMRILSVVRIQVSSMYGYDYMKKIVLHRVDLNQHIIAERDFKYLYPSDFEDQYGVQMIMRFNEIHKFSNGTLHQIDEALDYRVKEFKVNKMNPGLNTRFWTRKDVDRCKEFMFAIQKRLKTRRIFRNLESFVGGRVRDGDYRLLKRTE
nr:hypothetical protein [Tanacetum cinerariifolium]